MAVRLSPEGYAFFRAWLRRQRDFVRAGACPHLILSHIFLTDPISMKCQEILQRKISQAAPEERGVLRGTGEKP
jgi:hypothetical protein